MKIPSFKIFNFLGSPVKISVAFFLLFFLFPVDISIFILISVMLHEMAHSYAAHKLGYRTHGIDIGLLYGSASIDSNMANRDLLKVTLAGPLSNFILMGIGGLLYLIFKDQYIYNFTLVNLLLFGFNILPYYPMDGGVALKSYLNIKMYRRKARKTTALVSTITAIVATILFFSFGFIIMGLAGIFATYHAYGTYIK